MRILKHITALLACCMFSLSGHAVQIRREPGHRLPEYIIPTDPDNPVLWRGISATYYTRAAAPGSYATSDIQRTGTIEYPLVLIDFSDLSFTSTDDDSIRHRYDRIFNERGYSDPTVFTAHNTTIYGVSGSVSDYFRDQSYGQYNPVFKIIGPIHLSKGYAYYGGGERDASAQLSMPAEERITQTPTLTRYGRMPVRSISGKNTPMYTTRDSGALITYASANCTGTPTYPTA